MLFHIIYNLYHTPNLNSTIVHRIYNHLFLHTLSFNSLPPAQTATPQCESYRALKEDNREWARKSSALIEPGSGCNDDQTFEWNTWVRFQAETTNNSMMIADGCLSTVHNTTALLKHSYCGALYRGWIMGGHPSIEEGRRLLMSCVCVCILSILLIDSFKKFVLNKFIFQPTKFFFNPRNFYRR